VHIIRETKAVDYAK